MSPSSNSNPDLNPDSNPRSVARPAARPVAPSVAPSSRGPRSGAPRVSVRTKQLFLVACLVTLAVGSVGSYGFPWDVQRTYNLHTTTTDGLRVTFDVFEPRDPGAGASPRNAVILGHGIMVNKEVMKLTALELARAGFVAVALNFRGHGVSAPDFSGVTDTLDLSPEDPARISSFVEFGALARDIAAVKANYVLARGDVNASNLGYVGYSMGGGAGFTALQHDPDFRAMVGMAPAPYPALVNLTRPANLCIVVGRFDQAIPLEECAEVMHHKTGVATGTILSTVSAGGAWEHAGGSFAAGTAARLYVDPLGEHFLAGWNRYFVAETTQWMRRALAGQGASLGTPSTSTPELVAYGPVVAMIVLQVVGGVGVFFVLAGELLRRWASNASREEHPIVPPALVTGESTGALVKGVALHAVVLSFPCMLLLVPLFLGPLVFTAFDLMLLFGPSVAILVYLHRTGKRYGTSARGIYRGVARATSRRNVALGVGLGALFWGILEFSVGQVFSLLPAWEKWAWVPLYYAVTAFTFLNYYLYYHPVLQEKIAATTPHHPRLKAAALNYAMVVAQAVFILLVPCLILQNFFIWMFIWVVLGMLAAATGLGLAFYSRTGDVLLPALATAFFVSLMFCTLSPVVWVVALL